MKKLVLGFFSIAFTAGLYAQTLFTFGKNSVSKDEFLSAFNKNPTTSTDRKAAIKEYLDLYTNFKLKVQAAYDEGLEKDPTQQYELQNFRRQIADNIINEQANVKDLVTEAFKRSQKEILLSQIFIEVPADNDTTEAYRLIQMAYKDLQSGKKFEDIATEMSGDASQKNQGVLGYITAFSLSYRLENIIYSLPVNGYSAPFKTNLGYHIFKNSGERKPLGSRKVAQIMIAFPPNGTAEEKEAAQKKADSVYQLIEKGESFTKLAAAVSNDLSSNNNNGELPEFTTGTYSADFEQVAFSLEKPGQVTRPFQTAFGFHILKLIEAKSAPKDINDATEFTLMQEKVVKDNRMEQAKKNLITKTLATIKYKPAVYKEKDLFAYVDSSQDKKKTTVNGVSDNTVIFSFARQNYKASDFAAFANASKSSEEGPAADYKTLLNQFVNISADEYYRNHMEDYNADFSKQVKEFKDANLLFAIMEKKVWGKANADSAGLVQYYNEHKDKYQWPASADALIVTANNKMLTDSVLKMLRFQIADWRSVTGKFESDVIADSGRYELTQLPVAEKVEFTNGMFTDPVKNENDGSFTFNVIFKLYKDPSQRLFDDARGMVISDYQQVLEDKWIAELRKKYPVVVNKAVLETLK